MLRLEIEVLYFSWRATEMNLNFSIFENEFFYDERPITNRSGIESCAVDDFFSRKEAV